MDPSSNRELGITDAEIEALLEPFVAERLPLSDRRWRAIARPHRREARWLHRRQALRRLLGMRPGRTARSIGALYERTWEGLDLDDRAFERKPRLVPCTWRDEGLLASPQCTKYVHQLFLMRAIARLQPRSVLEVGCGMGHQLLPASARFPEARFTGLELTRAGTRAIRRAQQSAELPRPLVENAAEPPIDAGAHRRVRVVRGSGGALPFADASFDLVYTSLALEQMEQIRERALAEIARVAKRAAVLCEPFRDFNESGAARDYTRARGYFAARVEDLEGFGLRPVFVSSDMPSKLNIRIGVVVAERA